jgi:hypothetical protein
MYLSNATSFDEIVTYGVDPLIMLLDLLEDDLLDGMATGSREYLLWTEIKGKALMIREVSERISKEDAGRRKAARKAAC